MHPTPRLAAALLAGSGLGWPLLEIGRAHV